MNKTLINIDRITKLYTEARFKKMLAESYCYGPKSEMPPELDDQLMVGIFRMYCQADNLLKQLTKIRQIATDFVNINFEKYLDEHASYGVDEPFNPFDELNYCFKGEIIHDLPETIDQYDELYIMAQSYAYIKEATEGAIRQVLPNLTWHRTIKDGDEVSFVPESELPADLLNTFECEDQIKNIEVEHSLDGYNDFYSQCRALINQNRESGDIQTCASGILALFSK